MVRKGYVEQQIEGLARAIARMLALEDVGPEARLREIDRLCRAHTGFDLAYWCTRVGQRARGDRSVLGDDAVQTLAAARLMAEAAHIQPEKRQLWAARAILLAADAVGREPDWATGPAAPWFDMIRGSVDDAHRTPDLRAALAEWDEASGRLLAAESAWMALEDDGIPWASEQRSAFYGRLLERSDEELVSAGLPREEILEMLSFCEGD